MSGKAKPRLRGAKTGVNQNEEREKREKGQMTSRGEKRESLVNRRRDFCPAADALYDRYGEAKRNDTVAAWRAELIKAYQDCKSLKFYECDPSEVGDLIDILADMKIEQKTASGGGKMVGGNITAHFIRLQEWLTPKLARGAAAISDCAKWFINKILDGLTVIGGTTVAGANIAFSASMDLARTALGNNDTQTFQYLLAFCGMITSNTYAAGEKVHDWLQRARAAVSAAAAATGAAVGAVVQPYIDVFTQHMINLLTTQRDLFLGKIPGVNTSDEFDAWLKTLTMGDFMTATANIIAAGKWAPVAIAGGQIAGGLVLTTGYYGILAAAWISDSYILTGTWLTYQVYTGLPVTQKESITEAFKAVDEYLANRIIDSTTTQDFMDKIYHLKQDPIAKALVVARLKGEMTEAKVKQNEALGERAHVSRVKALTTALGDITAETTAIEQDTRNRQMHIDIQTAMGKAKKTNGAATRTGANAHPIVESNTTNAEGNTNINTAYSQTAAAGGGPGATPGAQQKVDAQSLGFAPGAASSGFAPGAQQKVDAQSLGFAPGAASSGFGSPPGAQQKMDLGDTGSSFGATGSGFGSPPGAQQKMDLGDTGSGFGTHGGKRATRKRGKRSSKRAPRKTKTLRKKRRGKK